MPVARYARSDRLELQVSDFLEGVPYSRIVPRQRERTCLRTMHDVLHGLSYALSRIDDDRRGVGPIDLVAEASGCLTHLQSHLSLSGEQWDALSAALSRAGQLPCCPQHGDLWAENIIMAGGKQWVIDFETFGEVQVPLYDDLTLVLSALSLRRRGGGNVVDDLLRDKRLSSRCRGLLVSRSVAAGLRPDQLDGVLVFHLLHRASSVTRRAGPGHAVGHCNAVRAVAGRLAAGQSGLLFGASG